MGRRIIDQIRFQQRKDTAENIAWRIRSRKAGELAIADRQARFPVLSAENADEALRYQEERVNFYMAKEIL